jgi:hypothetical protein
LKPFSGPWSNPGPLLLSVDFPSGLRAKQPMETAEQNEHFDVLIVGAGLSGIGEGYHLQRNCPGKVDDGVMRYSTIAGPGCVLTPLR